MTDLESSAWQIVDECRDAGHGPATVYAALKHVQRTGDVNAGYQILNQFRSRIIPRWLVDRWAHDADLSNQYTHRHEP